MFEGARTKESQVEDLINDRQTPGCCERNEAERKWREAHVIVEVELSFVAERNGISPRSCGSD